MTAATYVVRDPIPSVWTDFGFASAQIARLTQLATPDVERPTTGFGATSVD